MRRQAIIGALLLVGVGVVLGTTVFRADIAQATGLAQSVTVNNTAAKPLPVEEQNLDGSNIRVHEEGTARVRTDLGEPVQLDDSVLVLANENGANHVMYTVPAGKRLVIQYVEGFVTYPTGDDQPRISFTTHSGGSSEWFIFTPNPVVVVNGHTDFAGAQQVTLYADPQTIVQVFVSTPTGHSGNAIGDFEMSGVLVDVP